MQILRTSSIPGPQSWHGQGNALTGLCCVASILFALGLWILDNASAAISLSAITAAVSGFTAAWRFKRHGFDPLAVFCMGFSLYDGVLLFRLATVGEDTVLPYPVPFTKEAYASAGLLCVIAAGAVFLTAFGWEAVVEPLLNHRRAADRPHGTGMWFWSGFLMYAIGVVLYLLQFNQYGGYISALAILRTDRFDLDAAAGLSYPYLAFVVPGIACMGYGSQGKDAKGKKVAFYALVTLWCGLVLPQGDRRLALQAVLSVMAVLSVFRPNLLKLRFRSWFFIAAAYLLMCAFGNIRFAIAVVASGKSTASQVVEEIGSGWSNDFILPEHTEFAGPYLSLLSAVSDHTQYLYGSSYYESFLAVVPRFLYPGQKPSQLSNEFASQMHQGGGSVAGWGYNPVAEALVNFGPAGVAFLFVLWALFFLMIGSLRHRGVPGIILFSVLFSEAVNANRIDFANVYFESVHFLAGVVIATMINALLVNLARGSPVRLLRREHRPPTQVTSGVLT
jgi:hypothetical protein